MAAGKDKGTKLPGLPLMIPDATAGIDAYEFSVSSGAIIDWSLRGEVSGLAAMAYRCAEIEKICQASSRCSVSHEMCASTEAQQA